MAHHAIGTGILPRTLTTFVLAVCSFLIASPEAAALEKVFENPLYWYAGAVEQNYHGRSPGVAALKQMDASELPENRPVKLTTCVPAEGPYGPYEQRSYECHGLNRIGQTTSALARAVCARVTYDPEPTGSYWFGWCGYRVQALEPIQDENVGKCNNCGGNPINIGTGNKFQVEMDYASNDDGGLRFERIYNSLGGNAPDWADPTAILDGVGVNWRHNWQGALRFVQTGEIHAARWDGRVTRFKQSGSVWVVKADGKESLTALSGGGWLLTTEQNVAETYDADGKLVSIVDASGKQTTLTYSDGTSSSVYDGTTTPLLPGMLVKVTDFRGRVLELRYYRTVLADNSINPKGAMLSKVVDPAGQVYEYDYDANLNLLSVKYPGTATPRTYLYNESAYMSGTSRPFFLTGILDEAGNRYATYSYLATGRGASTQHAGGVENYGFTYPAAGQTTMTEPLLAVKTTTHQLVLGKVLPGTVTQPCVGCGTSTSRTIYDARGNPASYVDFNGNLTCFTFDSTRNLELARVEGRTKGPNDDAPCTSSGSTTVTRTITTEWHGTWRLRKRVAEPKRITTYSYHGEAGVSCAPSGASTMLLCSKSIQATTDTNGSAGFSATSVGSARTTAYTYNLSGQLLTVDGPRTDVTDVTTLSYYTADDVTGNYRIGDLSSVTNALSHVTQFTHYDGNGRLKRSVDPNGLATEFDYWPRGWLKSRRLYKSGEIDQLTQYDYNDLGDLVKVTQPDGSWLHFAYDAARRVAGVDDNLGNSIDYTLDNMGNRTEEKTYDPLDVLARKVRREYDVLSRLSKTIAANDAFTTSAYDGMGNLKTITQPASLSRPATTNLYDSLNRLYQTTDADAAVVKYEYDGIDQLAKVTDPRNLDTTYTLDGLGNQSQLVSPDTGTTAFSSFDAAGNLKTATDARSKTVNYTYDALNRVLTAVYADQTITYTYDQGTNGKGRLTRIVDATGQTDFTYDATGRMTGDSRAIGAVTLSMGYGYDASGRLSSVTYPSGRQVTYGFDTLGRIASVSVTAGSTTSLVTGVTYQPFGGIKGFTFAGSGATYARGYDLDGRVSSYKLGSVTYNLTYDDANSITKVSDPLNTTIDRLYSYDKVDRLLTFVTSPTALSETFTYDKTGNRLTRIVGGSTVTSTIASTSNRLTALGGVARSFDNSGNTTGDGTNTFTFDDRGRMTGATGSFGAATYVVNGMGHRVKKVVGSTATLFAFDGQGHIVGEYDGTGAPVRETIWIGDTPVKLLVGNSTFTAYDIWTDHLNTPRRVTDAANQDRWEWSQEDAFGDNSPNENPASLGALTLNLRFPGQYFDAETGNHYNYFRDYDPGVGRYVESDPIGLQGGINTYSYAAGNPLKWIDPKGQNLALEGGAAAIMVLYACAITPCVKIGLNGCSIRYPGRNDPLSKDRGDFWKCTQAVVQTCATFGMFGADPLGSAAGAVGEHVGGHGHK